ncbi:hypothetical protein [Streptomyces lydicus]|uniref:hypothetical protein n=1 Tax=Streptomyces lydicus TaxID=47763 RepID=UPI0037B2E11E
MNRTHSPSLGMELFEFAVALVMAAAAATGFYLVGDRLPFLLALALVGGSAFGLTALVSACVSRKEARR